jgi:hypothetical protein
MIKAVFIVIGSLFATNVFSQQWSPSGSNLYYNGGNVGIGITTPYQYSKLHIKAPGLYPWTFLVEANSSDKIIAISHNGTTGIIATGFLGTGGHSPLQFVTSDVARMSIDASGNVGIGTTTPNTLLHINNVTDVRKALRLTWNNDFSKYLNIWQGTGGAVIDPRGTGKLYLGYDQVTDVSVSGKLGIGKDPSYHLDISTPGDLQGIQLYHASGRWLRVFSSLTGGAFNSITRSNDAGIFFGADGGPVSNGFVIAPHNGGVSGLRIDQSGTVIGGMLEVAGGLSSGKRVVLGAGARPYYLVGILPTSSVNVSQKLKVEVFGGDWTSSTLGVSTYYISSRDGLQINQEIHGGSVGRFALKVFLVNGQYEIAVQATEDYPSFAIRSWKLDESVGLHELSITDYSPGGQDVTPVINTIYASQNNGNVGIGTSFPDAKLAVKGTIHANEVKVDLLGAVAPDYVFEKTYALSTLEEVKSYIDQNKHLPEIPSAKEMEANGVNLGEMDMLLLKKIEELTLYVIDLKKRDELQQIEIQNLKRKK